MVYPGNVAPKKRKNTQLSSSRLKIWLYFYRISMEFNCFMTFRNRFSQTHWILSLFGLTNILVGMLQISLLSVLQKIQKRKYVTYFLFLLQVCAPTAFSKSQRDSESPVWPDLGEISPWSTEHLCCVSVWPEGHQKYFKFCTAWYNQMHSL